VERARTTREPSLIEAVVARRSPHVAGGDTGYMDDRELAAAAARDPLTWLERHLITTLGVERVAVEELRRETASAVDEAYAEAAQGAFPPAAESTPTCSRRRHDA
jgi:TPP-dependent pyruvate/acetoin dehydrogenase alpha subunit